MTLPESEVDRITQRVFAARNSGLDVALVRVVIEEIDKVHATYQVAESDWRDRGEIIARLALDNQELRDRLTTKRHCRNCGWDVTPEPGDQR